MKIKIERIENQIVTCKIEDEGNTLIDVSRTYFPTDIKVGDIVDTNFEYQNVKNINSYSIEYNNILEKNK